MGEPESTSAPKDFQQRRVKVWIQSFTDRPSFQLQWIDKKGHRRTRTSGTSDIREAEILREELENQLSNGSNSKQRLAKLGYIYLIGGTGSRFKIGKSVNPQSRLKNLKVASHERLWLVHAILTDDMAWLEDIWHRRFSQQNVRGEWFNLSAADVERFTRVRVWLWKTPPIEGSEINDEWYAEEIKTDECDGWLPLQS